MTQRKALTLIVYAPTLVGRDHRALDSVHAMEKALPGLRLEWEIGEGGQLIALPQRDAWLVENIEDGAFPLLCNGDESYPVTVNGRRRSGFLSPGGQSLSEMHAKLPRDERVIAAAVSLLEGVAEGARAYWGHATPYGYGSEVSQQFRRSPHGPEYSPRGLPMLHLPETFPSPETPWFLGWLNYWSATVARTLDFPDPARDAELLSRSRRTATGGWVVQLTDAPLDLDNPAHLDALKRAYERFPEVGGRTVP